MLLKNINNNTEVLSEKGMYGYISTTDETTTG